MTDELVPWHARLADESRRARRKATSPRSRRAAPRPAGSRRRPPGQRPGCQGRPRRRRARSKARTGRRASARRDRRQARERKPSPRPRWGPADQPGRDRQEEEQVRVGAGDHDLVQDADLDHAATRATSPSRAQVRIVIGCRRRVRPAVDGGPLGAASSRREPLEHGDVLENQEVHERGHEDLGRERAACVPHGGHGTHRDARQGMRQCRARS